MKKGQIQTGFLILSLILGQSLLIAQTDQHSITESGIIRINDRPSPLMSSGDLQRQMTSKKSRPLSSSAGNRLLVPQQYASIQNAINASVDGDTVLVADSTYYENINFKGKAVTVASHFIIDDDTSHISHTIIDGSEPSNADSGSVVFFISGEDTTSILNGFTITGGSGTIVPAFFEESARAGGGILCYNSNARITNNRIMKNSVDDQSSLEARGGGIYSWSDSTINNTIIIEQNTVKQNTIDADSLSFGAGIQIGTNARITENLITANLSSSRRWSYGGGIQAFNLFKVSKQIEVTGNTITYNQSQSSQLYDGWTGGLDIDRYPDISVSNNTISYNMSGDNYICYSSGMYVGSAKTGSVIENNIISYNGSTVGFLNATIYIFESSGVIFRRNRIEHNMANWNAGLLIELGEENIIADNVISDNTATASPGGIQVYDSNPIIQNNLIINNHANNYGGGLWINGGQSGKNLNSNTSNDHQNAATGDFIHRQRLYHKKAVKTNSSRALIAADRPLIINNTIVNNTANIRGGGIYVSNSDPLVINSILWGNEAPEGSQIRVESGEIGVVYSDVQGSWPGTNNIDTDPLFVDVEDFSLSESSPCIGAGKDTVEVEGSWYYSPIIDFEGNIRPNPEGSQPDIGAFESPNDIPNAIEDMESDNLPKKFALDQNFPNPFNPLTKIKYQLPMPHNVELGVYNLLGQKIVTLVSERQEAGYHQVEWDASRFSSGVYFYRISAGEFHQVKKMILLR